MKHKKIIIVGAVVVGALGILACGSGSKSAGNSDNGGLGAGTNASPGASATAPTKAAGSFGEGTWQVGKDIKAGVYAAAVPNDSLGCYIEVSKDNSGALESIVHNDNLSAGSHVLVLVASGQYLKTTGCGDFAPASDSGPKSATFTEGVFRAGVEIAPGQYSATVPADSFGCYYQVSKNGGMSLASIVKNDNLNAGAHAVLTVTTGQWLKTDGCGSWTKQ